MIKHIVAWRLKDEALDAYQAHPEHVKLKQFAAQVADGRAVVDYEV